LPRSGFSSCASLLLLCLMNIFPYNSLTFLNAFLGIYHSFYSPFYFPSFL
jgi:hypothetical protein